MRDRFIIRDKDLRRKIILKGVKARRITLKIAAAKLDLSYRQVQRIYKHYLEEGSQGLLNKSRSTFL